VAALLLSAGGCGGSSGEAEALVRPEFVKQANAICLQAEEERKEATEDLSEGEGDSPEEALIVNEALLEPVMAMAEELGELGAPRGEEGQVGAIISAFRAGVAKVEAPAVAPLDAFVEANQLALDYGLTDCTI
jgi:hypothetical protein